MGLVDADQETLLDTPEKIYKTAFDKALEDWTRDDKPIHETILTDTSKEHGILSATNEKLKNMQAIEETVGYANEDVLLDKINYETLEWQGKIVAYKGEALQNENSSHPKVDHIISNGPEYLKRTDGQQNDRDDVAEAITKMFQSSVIIPDSIAIIDIQNDIDTIKNFIYETPTPAPSPA